MITEEEARYWWNRVLNSVTRKKFLDTFKYLSEREKYEILRETKYDEFSSRLKEDWKKWLMKKENGGIMLHGKRHKDGGIKMKGKDGSDYELEDREQILNNRVADIKDKIVCVGTGEGIGSALNELGGGVKWSNEGKCKIMEREFEKGGKVKILSTRFNSHKDHNPTADIVVGKIDSDSEITYVKNLNTGEESMEYYQGPNYVVGSTKKSFFRHFKENEIPLKYKDAWGKLKEKYEVEYELEELSNGGISKSKARKILHEGEAKGKPLTEQQRKFFGATASGYPMKRKKMENGGMASAEWGRVRDYAIDKLNDGIGDGVKGSELHNEIYNTDYFIIGIHSAKEFLNDAGTFDAIEKVKNYEQGNFGQVSTDLSDPEKVANMYAYIVGEEVLQKSKTLQDNWDKKLTKQDLKKILKELGSVKKMERGSKIKSYLRKGRKIEDKLLEEQALKDAEGGYMENGGYAGKTPEQVWKNWTPQQRTHFLLDHDKEINESWKREGNENTSLNSEKWYASIYSELPEAIKQSIKGHMMMEQYENGGQVENAFIKINQPLEFEVLELMNTNVPEYNSFRMQKVLKSGNILIMSSSDNLKKFLDQYQINYTEFENEQELQEFLKDQLPSKIKKRI